MPWKDIEKQRAAIRRHYYANKDAYILKALKRKQDIRKWVNGIKEESPCVDCNTYYPYYIMDFDHLKDKKWNINELIDRCSVSGLKDEIAKCEVVCSNCHRARTYARLQNKQKTIR